MAFAEGDAVPADAVVARLDDADIQARLRSKQQEFAVVSADIATAEERVQLVRSTWERTLAARERRRRRLYGQRPSQAFVTVEPSFGR